MSHEKIELNGTPIFLAINKNYIRRDYLVYPKIANPKIAKITIPAYMYPTPAVLP